MDPVEIPQKFRRAISTPVVPVLKDTDILAVVVKEPLFEVKQATVKGGEALYWYLGKTLVVLVMIVATRKVLSTSTPQQMG